MSDIVSSIENLCVIAKNIAVRVEDLKELDRAISEYVSIYRDAINHLSDALEKLNLVFKHGKHEYLFKYNIISCSIIKIWVSKIKPIEDFIKNLNEYGKEENCCLKYYKFAKLYRLSSPSTIKRRLQKYCDRVSEALSVVQGLNRSVFGSAIRIENPVMRKAWMLSGENQLNETALRKNILKENLYTLLKIELGSKLYKEQDKKNYIKLINKMLDKLDDAGGTNADDLISISEINELPEELNNYEEVNTLLFEYDKIRKDENMLTKYSGSLLSKSPSKTSFKSKRMSSSSSSSSPSPKKGFLDLFKSSESGEEEPLVKDSVVKINEAKNEEIAPENVVLEQSEEDDDDEEEEFGEDYDSERESIMSEPCFEEVVLKDQYVELLTSEIVQGSNCKSYPPISNGYGNDFPGIEIVDMVIPEQRIHEQLNDKVYDKQLVEITFTVIAKDQGWGGTNHAHIRYQIQDNACTKAFNISRDTPDNKYTFSMNGIDIDNGYKIKMWLCCPPWPGWTAEVQEINCNYKYC